MSFEGVFVGSTEGEPTFLAIRWESGRGKEGEVVILEATLCKTHRQEIAHEFPSARGYRQFVPYCDFGEGRRPKRT